MIMVKRVDDDLYKIIDDNGDEIHRISETHVTHPDDWVGEVRAAGYEVHTPRDWSYTDER